MQQPDISDLPHPLQTVCHRVSDCGGRAWLVGGSVRDMLLGLIPKDYDLEVYGLSAEALLEAVQPLGTCREVGRHFGVVKLWVGDMEIDLALPRTELKQGSGHHGFAVRSDPQLDEKTASGRRDFTINAMMLDPLSGTLLDYHDGCRDLEHGLLRHVSSAFCEDPLRPLRAMQFAARFRLQLDESTAKLCRALLAEAGTLSAARIWQEWRKWAHAPHPSFGLDALRVSGWLTVYPALAALIGCEQEAAWHPEGDVWTHTRLVVDCAADIATRYGWRGKQREIFIFAALCHDMGKPLSTFRHETGRIRSSGHAETGLKPSAAFLRDIAAPQHLIPNILPLVAEHLVHLHGQPTPRAVRRLSHRLQPTSIEMWEALVEADASGRAPLPADRPALPWLEQAKKMAVQHTPPKALIDGSMLIGMGLTPGPAMGELLAVAYQAQLAGEFSNEANARVWLSRQIQK